MVRVSLLALYKLLKEGESLLLASFGWSLVTPVLHLVLLLICVVCSLIRYWAHLVLFLIAWAGSGLETALMEHVRRAESRVLNRLVDIALLILTVLVILDHLQRIIIFLGPHRRAHTLLTFLNRLFSDFFDFPDDDSVEYQIGWLDGIFFQEVYQIDRLLDHLEEKHSDHFLDRLSIEMVKKDALDIPAHEPLDLTPHQSLIDFLNRLLLL